MVGVQNYEEQEYAASVATAMKSGDRAFIEREQQDKEDYPEAPSLCAAKAHSLIYNKGGIAQTLRLSRNPIDTVAQIADAFLKIDQQDSGRIDLTGGYSQIRGLARRYVLAFVEELEKLDQGFASEWQRWERGEESPPQSLAQKAGQLFPHP